MSGKETARLPLSRVLWAILFPERCAFCGRVVPIGEGVCSDCEKQAPVQPLPLCLRCGHSRSECGGHCRSGYADGIAAPYIYRDAVRLGVLRFKQSGDRLAAEVFAEKMGDTVKREWAEVSFDGISFVPMTEREQRAREYNQSEWLAKEVGKVLHIPVWNTLQKIRPTKPQKSLPAERRSGNLRGALDVNDDYRTSLAGKTVLLVDDVTTTGATLNECALMLKLYGAEAVYAVTLARTWKQEDEGDSSPS